MAYEDGLFKETLRNDFLDKSSFQIKPSKIHGKGVFALKEIHSKQYFYKIPLEGLVHNSLPNYARISSNFFVNDPFVLNYVNHSCDPNSEIVLDQRGAFLYSKRKILAGEEITVDYCLTEEKNTLIECKCKSDNCRNFFYITNEV